MALDQGIDTGRVRAGRLAAAARSILSCPAEVRLVVDGIDDVTAGLDPAHLDMQDDAGRPVFSCPADSPLATAAAGRPGAVLTLDSGLGPEGSADRDATLTLSGRLSADGATTQCPCCPEPRVRLVLQVDHALLSRAAAAGGEHVRVPLAAFASSEHDLNRGFLQRSAEHANLCHQAELRRAVATTRDTRLGDVLGVHLADLRPDGVELQWVDPTGAHTARLRFRRPAATARELGELLRTELHAGLC